MNWILSRAPAVAMTFAARLVILAAGFAASVVTARGLGPEGRGQYYAVITLAGIVAQFGNLGLSSSNTFIAAREPAVSWSLVMNGIWLSIAVAMAAALLVLCFGEEISSRLDVSVTALWTTCLLAPSILCFTLGSSVLVANERFAALSAWQIANALLALAALLCCAFLVASTRSFIAATTLAAAASVIGLTLDLGRGRRRTFQFDASLFKRGLSFALRAYFALLFGLLLQKAGVGLLTFLGRAQDIGLLSIAAQISDVLVIVPTSIGMVLFPMLVKQEADLWKTTRSVLLITMLIMLVSCAIAALVGRSLIPLIFGSAFGPSYDVLLYLLPGVLLVSAVTVLSQFLVAKGFPIALVIVWICGFAVCVAVGIPMTRSFGAQGAAAAQSAAMGAVCLGVVALTVGRIRKRLPIAPGL